MILTKEEKKAPSKELVRRIVKFVAKYDKMKRNPDGKEEFLDMFALYNEYYSKRENRYWCSLCAMAAYDKLRRIAAREAVAEEAKKNKKAAKADAKKTESL